MHPPPPPPEPALRALPSAEIHHRRRERAGTLSRAGFVAFGLGYLGANLFESPGAAAVPHLCYLVGIGLWMASFVHWLGESWSPGVISVAGGALRIERERERALAKSVPLADVVSAQSVPRGQRYYVEIALRGGDVYTALAPSLADADDLVAALGFGRGARRQTIELAAPGRRLMHVGLGALTYVLGVVPGGLLLVLFYALTSRERGLPQLALVVAMNALTAAVVFTIYFALRRRFAAPVLEIGDDGVVVIRGRRRQFHPRSELVGAESGQRGRAFVALRKAGDVVIVHATGLDEPHTRAAVHVMTRRWAGERTEKAPTHASVVAFSRMGRPVDAWRAEIRARLAGHGYRDEGLSVDAADAVLRDERSPPDARIGAALALTAAGQKLRVADVVAPLADERLRVALESIAEGRDDPALLEEALGQKRARLP